MLCAYMSNTTHTTIEEVVVLSITKGGQQKPNTSKTLKKNGSKQYGFKQKKKSWYGMTEQIQGIIYFARL